MTLILVTSLEAHSRDKALDALIRTRPQATVIRHDLLEGERVLRRVSIGQTTVERKEIPLEHGCLTCTVRLDVVPTVMRILASLPGDVVVGLPLSVNADMAIELLEPLLVARGTVLDSVCLALDPAALEDQMWDSRTLWQAGLSSVREDDRTAGEFLVKEIAFADTVLLVEGLFAHLFESKAPGCQSGGELFLRGNQLLVQLGPHLVVQHPENKPVLGSYLPAAARRRSTPGAVGTRPMTESVGNRGSNILPGAFTTLDLQADRPLHPARLRDALPLMAEGCVWLRGTLWIASSPGTKMVLGGAGPFVWLEGRGQWRTETARTHISLTSDNNHAEMLAEKLRSCELSDREMLVSPESFEDEIRISRQT